MGGLRLVDKWRRLGGTSIVNTIPGDCTDGVQAAIDSLSPGDTLYFPSGTYNVRYNGYSANVSLNISISDINIEFDDLAELKMITNGSDYYSIFHMANAENITITGGIFTGDRGTHTEVTGQFGYGISLWNCKNITIDGVTCQECWGDGIFVDGDNGTTSQNVDILNSTCNHNRRQGISIINLNGGNITDCILTNQDDSSPMGGIDFEPYMAGQTTENITVSGCTISGNTGSGVIGVGMGGATVSDITIDGNTITGNTNNAFYIDTASGFIIENNIVNDSTQGIRCITCDNFTIESNTVSDCSDSGINLDTLSHDCVAQYNSCTGITGSSGIQIGGGSFDNTVTNNTLTGNLWAGVSVGGAGAGNVVSPNIPFLVYPDAHPESTSVDGDTQRNTPGTWAQIIAGAGEGSSDSTDTVDVGARATANLNEFTRCWRTILVFDTSLIPAGALIDSAQLYVNMGTKVNDLAWSNAMAALCVVSATPATHTALVNADYGTFGSTRLAADVPYNVVALGGNTITLNTAGRTNINKGPGAVSEFGLKTAADIDGSATWVDSKEMYYQICASELADATIPRLEVTYHVP